MAKPRIIIADEDIDYINPLQLKFIEEFFQKIDLEIITDGEYFDQLFESPQRAEILIISEDLYNMSLQRHNISNIFVMTEQYEELQTEELNINRIFKYTSIKEIFNEIIGKSAESLNIESSKKQETQVIVVTSAAGGVGKTTIAMGLSASLAQNYKKVLYIDAEQLQTFQSFLKNDSKILDQKIYLELVKDTDNAYEILEHTIRRELFSYIPPFKTALLSLNIKNSIYRLVVEQAKKKQEYDYIVIDTDNTFDEEKAKLLAMANKVVIVTNQKYVSVHATNTLVKNINGINSDKYIVLCNDFDKNKENSLISAELKIDFSVNEYVNHILSNGIMYGLDLANVMEFQKLTYLLD